MDPTTTTTDTTSRRLTRRVAQLWLGLVLYGASLALLVQAELGLAPWDVLHEGLSLVTPLSIGMWVIVLGAVVLLLWIPLRQRPGFGTISNVILVGIAVDVTLAVLPTVSGLLLRIGYLVAGLVLNGIATAAYIGARLGPGPRDGLMTGLATKGLSIRLARTLVEATVLIAGFLLGGTVGIGTLLYAFGIGPLVHPLMPLFEVPATGQRRRRSGGFSRARRSSPRRPGPRR
jgi:uncharacterized membrane protein YczE